MYILLLYIYFMCTISHCMKVLFSVFIEIQKEEGLSSCGTKIKTSLLADYVMIFDYIVVYT